MDTQLDHETKGWIRNTNFLIIQFAYDFKVPITDAFEYLKKYGGLDFLYKHYWALHTDNPLYAVRDLLMVCRNNGGYL
jgi:hypothetical protein